MKSFIAVSRVESYSNLTQSNSPVFRLVKNLSEKKLFRRTLAVTSLDVVGSKCPMGIKRLKNLATDVSTYSVFHRFGQAQFANGGLILSLSQFSLLP